MMEVIFGLNKFELAEESRKEETLPLFIKGKSVNAGYIKNKNFYIPDDELDNIANTLKNGLDGTGAYILKDHGYKAMFGAKSVDLLVGKVSETSKDGRNILYKGRIEDADLAHKMRRGLVSASSLALRVKEAFCSICGREYGHPECNHILGQEYPEEGFHANFKNYLPDFENKAVSTIIGKGIEALEQSIVLFPAIEGATAVPMFDFTEGTETFIKEVEQKKIPPEEVVDEELFNRSSQIVAELDKIIEGFNRELSQTYIEQLMSEELNALKEQFEAFKLASVKTTVDLNAKLETAQQVIQIFQTEKAQKLKLERDAKIVELTTLRKDKKLPEKDYSNVSDEVLVSDLEMLKALVTSTSTGVAAGDPQTILNERKEDIREVLFQSRKDNKALKGLRSL